MTALPAIEDGLKPDSTARLVSVRLNSVTFPKHCGCTSDYLSTTVPRTCLKEVRLTTQNCFKTVLYLNSGVLVLLSSLEGNGLFQGRSLSYCNYLDLHCSVPAAEVLYLPGKYRSHLRKDTCGISETFAP